MNTKTYQPKSEDIKRQTHLIDASGKVLGRLATELANILRGKNKNIFLNSVDCGDSVVVINAEKIVLTGNKLEQKTDFRHSGYPGGDTITYYKELMEKHPDRVLLLAVKGMLPKNRLAHVQLTRLKVYRGSTHPHGAQTNAKKSENQ
jgi:large subunit ribosomal protein L13